ncbi:MAG: glutaredoxin 3 [Deltaproteobacteria bacterium]|nr:glutaredoxin 3 [Deltaproteobacteria bacterium]MBI3387244.1 glutaredoxin 3 [Deltaproteobacteria bacterium]
MANVRVYTTASCPFCVRAKQLLTRKGVAFDEIDVGDDDALREQITRETGWRTVPQIFVGDRFIGGFEELKALDADGQLDPLLAAS